MQCGKKVPYIDTRRAFAALEKMGDPWLQLYVCSRHQALHLGHQPYRRSYATWQAAMDGAAYVHSQQKVIRRMRVYKQDGRWHIEWAPVRPVTLGEARRVLGLD